MLLHRIDPTILLLPYLMLQHSVQFHAATIYIRAIRSNTHRISLVCMVEDVEYYNAMVISNICVYSSWGLFGSLLVQPNRKHLDGMHQCVCCKLHVTWNLTRNHRKILCGRCVAYWVNARIPHGALQKPICLLFFFSSSSQLLTKLAHISVCLQRV